MRQVTVRGIDGVYRSGPPGAWWLSPQPSDGVMREAAHSRNLAAIALYPFFAAYVQLTGPRQAQESARITANVARAEAEHAPRHRAALAAEHALDGCHERFGCHRGCRYAAQLVSEVAA